MGGSAGVVAGAVPRGTAQFTARANALLSKILLPEKSLNFHYLAKKGEF